MLNTIHNQAEKRGKIDFSYTFRVIALVASLTIDHEPMTVRADALSFRC